MNQNPLADLPKVDNMFIVLLPPASEVCEGYVFTGVCLSTGVSAALHAEIHLPPEPEADTHPEQTHPLCSACWDMVNKRAVCIPLEWILVDFLNLIYFSIDYSRESRILMRGCQEPKLVCSPSPFPSLEHQTCGPTHC